MSLNETLASLVRRHSLADVLAGLADVASDLARDNPAQAADWRTAANVCIRACTSLPGDVAMFAPDAPE